MCVYFCSPSECETLCRSVIDDFKAYGLSVIEDFLGVENGLKVLSEVHQMHSAGIFEVKANDSVFLISFMWWLAFDLLIHLIPFDIISLFSLPFDITSCWPLDGWKRMDNWWSAVTQNNNNNSCAWSGEIRSLGWPVMRKIVQMSLI